jgi:hypothetical protein
MMSTAFCIAKEPADPKLDPHRSSFPVQMAAVSAMNPQRRMSARWTNTHLASRAKNHHEPASPFDQQLDFFGIRQQYPLSHRHTLETTRT